MFRLFKKRIDETIGNKLFALFVLVLVLAIGPIFINVLSSVSTFGEYSTKVNEAQIRKQVVDYLSRVGHEQVYRYEEYFSRVSAIAELVAGQVEPLYQNISAYSALAEKSVDMQFWEDKKTFFSTGSEVVHTFYSGREVISSAIAEEINALKSIDSLFIQSKALLPESEAIHLITRSGIGKYCGGRENAYTLLQKVPESPVFDLRDTIPYTIFSNSNWNEENVRWTKIYNGFAGQGLMITVASPVVSANGGLLGVMGIDLLLNTIIDELILEENLEEREKEINLVSFLLNCDGDLISSPKEIGVLLNYLEPFLSGRDQNVQFTYNLKFSINPEVSALMSRVIHSVSLVDELLLEGERYLVASETLPSQGWKLVMVAKESDLLSSVIQTKIALGEVLGSLKVKFVLSTFCLVIIVLICCYLAVSYFVRPVQELSLLARRVGDGDLSKKSSLNRKDELGVLSDAMNTMIDSLAAAESFKKEYLQKLQKGIHERTADLQEKTVLLSEAMRKVHNESKKRKKISIALREREKQLLITMEASLAGLCIVQGHKFKYINFAIEQMFGYSKVELVDKKGPLDLVVKEFRTEALQRLVFREKGKKNKQGTPYHVKCRRKNNEIFDVEVDSSFITWNGTPAAVGTLVDISEHVQAKEKISENEKRLKALLDEKDILLREVYHRTKNNMLVIISLLALQMDKIEDEKALKIFEEMEHRIRAMALVHENLYQSENLVEINLGEYLAKMVRTQVDHMTFSDLIEVKTDYCQVTAPFDQAVPLGLIVSELITNAVKYAFPAGQKGVIRLNLSENEGMLYLVVEDNGVGLPPEVDVENPSSFGLQITTNMIIKQLGGALTIQKENGTAFHIRFRLNRVKGK